MASRKLDDLTPQARDKAFEVLASCEQAGVDLLIYCTLRTLQEQARLYRQSRPYSKIQEKINRLKAIGFGFLADIIEKVGPCSGPHVTNAAPGESWHNYGEAWDAVILLHGKAMWSYDYAQQHWNRYGECVRQAGMTWAGDWQKFREFPHSQLRAGGNPLKELPPDQVYKILKDNKLLPRTKQR